MMTAAEGAHESSAARLMQIAFVVEHLADAMALYQRQLNAGPWFLMERFTPSKAVYRGQPTNLLISVAFAYCNDVMLELVQQHDDSPSVFREVIATRGYGLHHLGLTTTDYESAIGRYIKSGYEVAFTAETPGRLAIMQAPGLPHMMEVLELDPRRRDLFNRIYEASRGWDGSDPVRPASVP